LSKHRLGRSLIVKGNTFGVSYSTTLKEADMNKKFWTGFVAVLVAMEIMMFLIHGVILKSAYEATHSV
jgi:hypothetical protein